jgi:hypothetical protein
MMPGAALAGPCTQQLAQFETAVQRSTANPDAGPTAPETTAVRLGHQPTIASVKRAEAGAETRFTALLARAHTLDTAGDRAGCTRALTDAERNYELPPDSSALSPGTEQKTKPKHSVSLPMRNWLDDRKALALSAI